MDYHNVYFSAIISREWAMLFDVSGLFGHRCMGVCVSVGGTQSGGRGRHEGGHGGRNAKARGGGGSGSCSVVLMD